MRQFLSILLISFGFIFQTTNKDLEKDLNKNLLIIEYNAPFNLKNAYKGFDLLSGVSKNRVCIETSPNQRQEKVGVHWIRWISFYPAVTQNI